MQPRRFKWRKDKGYFRKPQSYLGANNSYRLSIPGPGLNRGMGRCSLGWLRGALLTRLGEVAHKPHGLGGRLRPHIQATPICMLLISYKAILNGENTDMLPIALQETHLEILCLVELSFVAGRISKPRAPTRNALVEGGL